MVKPDVKENGVLTSDEIVIWDIVIGNSEDASYSQGLITLLQVSP